MLDGVVEMRYRVASVEKSTLLEVGDIFLAEEGCEHVAHRWRSRRKGPSEPGALPLGLRRVCRRYADCASSSSKAPRAW